MRREWGNSSHSWDVNFHLLLFPKWCYIVENMTPAKFLVLLFLLCLADSSRIPVQSMSTCRLPQLLIGESLALCWLVSMLFMYLILMINIWFTWFLVRRNSDQKLYNSVMMLILGTEDEEEGNQSSMTLSWSTFTIRNEKRPPNILFQHFCGALLAPSHGITIPYIVELLSQSWEYKIVKRVLNSFFPTFGSRFHSIRIHCMELYALRGFYLPSNY